MKLDTKKIYYGFKILKFAHVEDVNADCYIMEHIKTGARLVYLDSEDDNKVFSIGFRTPPYDDSGVAHILEHSCLCGSRKYHLKEPFVELVKGSLNTFLNAMTYPDKTVYPVASRNDKDFANLMDVYLDAVFYPLIYENPYTLKQEGWHYEINDVNAPLQYNGVVYNEMKGVYSSPDAYLENVALKTLFPDNAYRFESGGYPDAIPQLTQEKFLDFHKKYYSPENSYIYLYGNMDIDATLRHLTEEYLDKFTKSGEVHSEIALQKPFAKTKEMVTFYPVEKDADLRAKVYHELSVAVSEATDFQTCTALRLLEKVLLEAESGPLRRALIDAKIGQNVSGNFSGSLRQPLFCIRVSGSEEKYKDDFVSVIYKELQKLSVNGIDRKLLEAALNHLEFTLLENDFGSYPKGLVYGLNIMDSWIYGADPIESLQFKHRLAELRNGLKTDYYEKIIETYLLDNSHKVLVTLLPKQGKQEEDTLAENKKLANLKSEMSKEQLEKYVAECAELHRRQAAEDSPEDLASIPVLKRDDIRKEIDKIDRQIEKKGNSQNVYIPLKTNGIVYVDWEFDVSGISADKIPYLMLFGELFGKFDTERYTYQDLFTNIIMYTGGISGSAGALSKYDNADDYTIQFSLRAKVLADKLDKLFDLLQAVTLETRFTDKKRFKELLAEIKTDWDNEFFNRGMSVALSRLYSYCSDAARVNEYESFEFYRFIKDLYNNFEEKAEITLQILGDLAKVCFNKSKYQFFYACDWQDKEKVLLFSENFIQKLSDSNLVGVGSNKVPLRDVNEGITTSGKVQYVVAGGNFRRHGFDYSGSMRVLMTILSYEYLWIKIRVQGGAYGASARFSPNGLMAFTSYRDPQLVQSLEAYRGLPDWLRNKQFTEQELDKYVIGTISAMDTP
ncbi:MAG: insulinase family protein, partial [Phascolarctobacterium sp.]|nr:insulinase family protein [Candidatus Phascolarctobacterium caballi]